jgi:hypothetical protein
LFERSAGARSTGQAKPFRPGPKTALTPEQLERLRSLGDIRQVERRTVNDTDARRTERKAATHVFLELSGIPPSKLLEYLSAPGGTG